MGTIHALFRDRAFEPERLMVMGEAYDLVIKEMPKADSEEVAAVIIEMAQRGVMDAPTLATSTLDWLIQQSRKEA
jgi:UDP-2,3-diacylglucosamine pyrophosphatase LpxH